MRIGRSIEHYNLDIERTGWTAGTPVSRYLEAFKVDLFLSVHSPDVEEAVNSGVAAATILPHTPITSTESDMVKIAFDGDAVIFGDESEKVYQEKTGKYISKLAAVVNDPRIPGAAGTGCRKGVPPGIGKREKKNQAFAEEHEI